MAKMFFKDLWKQSYLLEILDPSGSPEYYTFSLPPESVEYVFGQRISETKTFGGVFFDDYGPDTVRITLSGHTGNSELKRVYRGPTEELWLSGKDELFWIRDRIIRYKDRIKDYDKVTINLYNLSMAESSALDAGGYQSSSDSWEVVLKDFKVSKSKDRPFQHNYSIDFVGIRILGQKKKSPVLPKDLMRNASLIIQQIEETDREVALFEDPELIAARGLGLVKPQTVTAVFKAAEDIYAIDTEDEDTIPPELDTSQAKATRMAKIPVEEKVLRLTPEIAPYTGFRARRVEGMTGGGLQSESQASKVMARAEALELKEARAKAMNKILKGGPLLKVQEKMQEFSGIIKPFRNQLRRFKQGITTWKNILNGLPGLAASPFLDTIGIAKDAYGIYNEVISAPAEFALSLVSAFKDVRKTLERTWDQISTGGLLPDHVKSQYAEVADAYHAEYLKILDAIGKNLDNTAADLLRSESTPTILPTPDGSKAVYGYFFVEADETTTLEAIAAKYLGDPDLAIDIAIANGLASDTLITPGMFLKIPRYSPDARNKANLVYSLSDEDKILGSDVYLRAGVLAVDSNGDLQVVSGMANMSQAIQSRLSETLGTRLRLGTYGIKSIIGSPTQAAEFVATAIKDTLLADPRIHSIDNFTFQGRYDALYVGFDYTTWLGASRYEGAIR